MSHTVNCLIIINFSAIPRNLISRRFPEFQKETFTMNIFTTYFAYLFCHSRRQFIYFIHCVMLMNKQPNLMVKMRRKQVNSAVCATVLFHFRMFLHSSPTR